MESGLWDVSGVGGVFWEAGFSDDNFLVGDSSIFVNLLDSCTSPISVLGINEQQFVGIVGGISLVVELNVVPVDQMSNLSFDGSISSIGVFWLSNEIGGLRGMSQKVVSLGKNVSDSLGAFNQPILTLTFIHGFIIFVIQINSIQIILLNVVGKLAASGNWISVSWIPGSSESAQHDLNTILIVNFSPTFLDFSIS